MQNPEVGARFERLDKYIADGSLLRGAWWEGERRRDGYDRACLLLAIAPECGKRDEDGDASGDPAACPSWLLPEWLARLTPWLDDTGSDEAWPEHVRRYSRAVRLVPSLGPDAQRRLLFAVCASIVRSVLEFAGSTKDVCERVLALLERAAAGEAVSDGEWETAHGDARAEAAAAAARWAAEAAEAARDRLVDGVLLEIEKAVGLAA